LLMDDVVAFKISGKLFEFSRQQLEMYPNTLLAKLIDKECSFNIVKDSDGCIILYRDPEYFRVISNYIIYGQLIFDYKINPLGVYEEAKFLSFDEVVDLLKGDVDDSLQRYKEDKSEDCDMIVTLIDGSILNILPITKTLYLSTDTLGDVEIKLSSVIRLSVSMLDDRVEKDYPGIVQVEVLTRDGCSIYGQSLQKVIQAKSIIGTVSIPLSTILTAIQVNKVYTVMLQTKNGTLVDIGRSMSEVTKSSVSIDDDGIHFSEQGSQVTLRGKDNLSLEGDFTIKVWVMVQGVGTSHPMICIKQPCNLAYLLWLCDDLGTRDFAFRYNCSEGLKTMRSGVNPTYGRWYHLVVTRTLNDIYLYIDGELKVHNRDCYKISTTSGPLSLGNDNQLEYHQFIGIIRSFCISDTFTSEKEVKELFFSNKPNSSHFEK